MSRFGIRVFMALALWALLIGLAAATGLLS
jgi:hypothetical protein